MSVGLHAVHRASDETPPEGLEGPPAAAGADFLSRAATLGVDLSHPVAAGTLRVDVATYSVVVDGLPVALTSRQVECFGLFVARPLRVWSRGEVDWACWGQASTGRRVDVQLSRIRTSVGRDVFRTVRNRGWALLG